MALDVRSQKVMDKVGMTVASTLPSPDFRQQVEDAELAGLRYEIAEEQWQQGQRRRPAL